MRALSIAVSFCALVALAAGPALAAGGGTEDIKPSVVITPPDWSFEGPFGRYDRAAVQRGFQVYREVCATCHSLSLVSYRHLGEKGGPYYNPAFPNPTENPVIKAIAAEYQVRAEPDELGTVIEDGAFRMRPAIPSDYFASPYANENAAKAANGGALPPDFSVIAKARQGGPDYLYQLLLGYEPVPAGVHEETGSFNPWFPGDWIAMPEPMSDGMITFADGSEPRKEQLAADVAHFLMWAAEPRLEERKRRGVTTMVFLVILAGLLYASYRRVWAQIGH